MKYRAMFGRYQPWHKGHQWLLDELLDDDPEYGVWIGVRDIILKDEHNPYHPIDVVRNIRSWAREHRSAYYHKIIIRLIPDIEGVHYGRGVGWSIVEHIPPADIGKVSATKIRDENKTNTEHVRSDSAGPLNDGPRIYSEEELSEWDGEDPQRNPDNGD